MGKTRETPQPIVASRYAGRGVPTKYGPKEQLSPTIGTLCPMCGIAFKVGDYTALVRTTRHSRYGDTPVEVHWDCAMKVND